MLLWNNFTVLRSGFFFLKFNTFSYCLSHLWEYTLYKFAIDFYTKNLIGILYVNIPPYILIHTHAHTWHTLTILRSIYVTYYMLLCKFMCVSVQVHREPKNGTRCLLQSFFTLFLWQSLLSVPEIMKLPRLACQWVPKIPPSPLSSCPVTGMIALLLARF